MCVREKEREKEKEREREREKRERDKERERESRVYQSVLLFFTKTHHNQKNVDLKKVDNIFG
jgi:hypothetical protein